MWEEVENWVLMLWAEHVGSGVIWDCQSRILHLPTTFIHEMGTLVVSISKDHFED